MRASPFVVVLALASVGCSADFAAALHVVIDGPALIVGGGYWIELRQTDGGAIDGVSRQFVEFAPGDQDVTVVLERDDFFGGNDSRQARLLVDAVPQRNAPVAARGAVLVEIDRGEVEELSVTLADDPRPLPTPVAVDYDADLGAVTVDPASLPSNEAVVFDLWVDAGEPVWVERLSGGSGAALDVNGHRAVIGANGLRLVVTAEPADSPQPLVRSSGWPVFRGAMPKPLVEALVTVPYAEQGIFAAMQSVLDTAEAHRGFALTAHANNDESGVVSHSEHVFSAIAGEAVSEDESSGTPGDLDGDGVVMYVVTDRTGIGPGTVASPGYLRRLIGVLADLEATLDVSDALTCATHLGDAVVAALDAAEQLAGAPLDPDSAEAFDTAIMRVRGDTFDVDSVATSPAQTTLCSLAVLQSLADFDLTPLAAGAN